MLLVLPAVLNYVSSSFLLASRNHANAFISQRRVIHAYVLLFIIALLSPPTSTPEEVQQ